jgi:hypothetical protein
VNKRYGEINKENENKTLIQETKLEEKKDFFLKEKNLDLSTDNEIL